MNYFVILPDGSRFGPADLALLNTWAREGRLIPASVLEEEGTGRRLPSHELVGLVFPTSGMSAPPWGAQGPGPQPGPPGPGPAATPWSQPPGPVQQPGPLQGPFAGPGQPQGPGPSPLQGYYRSPYGPQSSSNLTTAWILGAVSIVSIFLCCCSYGILSAAGIVCGGLGMNCANKAKRDGYPNAQGAWTLNLIGFAACCVVFVGGIVLLIVAGAGGFSGFGR